jgi:hypothetical protein
MTEESEHYMNHPRVQATYDLTGSRIQGGVSAYNLIGSRIQGGVSAYNLIGSRTRGYKPLTTLLDPESEGTQVACDLIGYKTRHTR